jgi:hypothetical protein
MGDGVRGRPQRAAREPASNDNLRRLRSRIAWMLRVNRLYGHEPAWVSGAAFSAAFAGGCHPDAVSGSKISRWETGLTAVPHRAVRRYEQLLGLSACSLTSTVDIVTRFMSPSDGARQTGGRRLSDTDLDAGHRLESFLERAISSATVAAAEWDDAAKLITQSPGLWLRRRDWDSICQRLLAETVTADGEAWKPRFEAFSRLLQYPDSQPSAVAACFNWVNCRDSQVFIEVLSLLDGCRHPDASKAVLSQLRAPTNDEAFTGALRACIRKVAERHFTPSQLTFVADVTADVLSTTSHPAQQELHLHAAAVSTWLPAPLQSTDRYFPRGLSGFSDPGTVHARPPSEAAAGNSFSAMITAWSIGRLPREIGHFDDQIFPALIDEILYSPIADARLYAAFLVRATPYARPASNALARSLGRIRHDHTPYLTVRILEGIRILGDSGGRAEVEKLTSPFLPFPIQDAAFRALGHIGGTSTASFWEQALALHGSSNAQKSSEQLVDHAVYALGVERNLFRLEHIATDAAMSARARAAARWWINLPRHILVSAEK